MKKLRVSGTDISIAIRIILCIGLLYFILFYQAPMLKNQIIDLEQQKELYARQQKQWQRDSIRREREIQMLDSALYRLNNLK